jgi:glucose-6-phosphate isomerase
LARLFADDALRAERLVARLPGLQLEFSRQCVDARTLDLLTQLAVERGFEGWRAAMASGEKINSSEGRAVSHMALRSKAISNPEVGKALFRVREISERLRSGRKIRRVINLGAGGSDLGPRLFADAFGDGTLDVRFVASVDPLELQRALAGAVPAETLVIVVSKTFTTQETLANANAARDWGCEAFIAVTANPQRARAFGAQDVLPMWDWVGGRFSIWSAANLAAVCATGFAAFDEFLTGGRELDHHFLELPAGRSVPGLMGLLGVWNVNFLGSHAHAILPYGHRLRLLPAYLQQLEMESNGKHTDRCDRIAKYATCPVVFGSEGTPSQHSFHQLLHQGTQAVPADFILAGIHPVLEANAEAQARALAFGTLNPGLPAFRRYPGNRPSSTLRLDSMDPRGLGLLLAAYEHKVFTQGVIWNINSFDQWGVELGKQLAAQILAGTDTFRADVGPTPAHETVSPPWTPDEVRA